MKNDLSMDSNYPLESATEAIHVDAAQEEAQPVVQIAGSPVVKSNRQLARELGIHHATVALKRNRGLSDEEIAEQAPSRSMRHDPMKRKRHERIALVEAVATATSTDSGSANAELKGGASPAAQEFSLAPPSQPAAPAMGAMAEASLRKEQAEARLKELKLEEEEGRLIDIDTVGQELSRLVRECRDGMLGMASRLAPRVASLNDERQIYVLMTDEIEQSLHAVTSKLEHYAEAA